MLPGVMADFLGLNMYLSDNIQLTMGSCKPLLLKYKL